VGLGISVVSGPLLLYISIVFFLLIAAVLWKITEIFSLLLRLYKRFLKWTNWQKKEWAGASVEKIDLAVKEIEAIRKRKIYGRILVLSLFIRLAKYGALYFLLAALLRSHGFFLGRISFWKTILGTTGAELTSVLPIKGLGGFGTWDTAWALTFQLMDFDPELAVISGIGVHLIANSFEYVLGLAAILLLLFPLLKRKKTSGTGTDI
jgi:hypothetical protein